MSQLLYASTPRKPVKAKRPSGQVARPREEEKEPKPCLAPCVKVSLGGSYQRLLCLLLIPQTIPAGSRSTRSASPAAKAHRNLPWARPANVRAKNATRLSSSWHKTESFRFAEPGCKLHLQPR